MIAACPKCGGKRIDLSAVPGTAQAEMRLCDRDVGCTAQPRCESPELRRAALPFETDYHAHRRPRAPASSGHDASPYPIAPAARANK